MTRYLLFSVKILLRNSARIPCKNSSFHRSVAARCSSFGSMKRRVGNSGTVHFFHVRTARIRVETECHRRSYRVRNVPHCEADRCSHTFSQIPESIYPASARTPFLHSCRRGHHMGIGVPSYKKGGQGSESVRNRRSLLRKEKYIKVLA